MEAYISPEKCKTFRNKPAETQRLINETLFLLEVLGVPVNDTQRRLERMAMAFLACSDIRKPGGFKGAKDLDDNYSLKTREIISFVNQYFSENISAGSYDDIRRKDLKLLTAAGVVLPSNPDSATNDSFRGYGINPFFTKMIRSFGEDNWEQKTRALLSDKVSLAQKLLRIRDLEKLEVALPSGIALALTQGAHNDLQKSIIEEFLPRFGYGAEVLYIGDASNKYLHLDQTTLEALNFFQIAHEELPDIIAYSRSKNWLYLIEAAHTSGPISELRLMQLKHQTSKCSAEIIFVTAFADRKKFRQFMAEIAWETEVWLADNPDHLIHFDGEKFLGPY